MKVSIKKSFYLNMFAGQIHVPFGGIDTPYFGDSYDVSSQFQSQSLYYLIHFAEANTTYTL